MKQAPRDKETLTKLLEHIKEYMDLWNQFYQDLEQAMTLETVSDEIEEKFLTLKGKLATGAEYLTCELGAEDFPPSVLISPLNMAFSLLHLKKQPPLVIATIRNQWHDGLISINRVLNRLQEELKSYNPWRETQLRFKSIFQNPTMHKLIVLIVIFIVIAIAWSVGKNFLPLNNILSKGK